MSSKNILVITSSFNRSEDNPNLINDLVGQLSRDGHRVMVIAVDWNGSPGRVACYIDSDGAKIVFIPPEQMTRRTMFHRAFRFATASFGVLRKARPHVEGLRADLLVAIAPLTNQLALILWLQRHLKCRSYAYVTDFFPYHHRQIGMVPAGAPFLVARVVEAWLLRMFDVIGCMSPANITYLRAHYRLRPCQHAEVLPLWGRIDAPAPKDKSTVRAAHNLPSDRRIIVYGGQLSEGRGFDEILATARLASMQRSDLFFLIIGTGPLEGRIRDAVACGQNNIALRTRIARADYLSLLAACDIGLVCTVPGVDVPTFPSKTIDLLRASVPVVASVEVTTDYGNFVQQHGFGVAIDAGSPERMLAAIAGIVDHPEKAETMRVAARKTLVQVFDVRKISWRLIAQCFPEEGANPDETMRVSEA